MVTHHTEITQPVVQQYGVMVATTINTKKKFSVISDDFQNKLSNDIKKLR
jgi:endo-1,4-beta-D-glucanase Y